MPPQVDQSQVSPFLLTEYVNQDCAFYSESVPQSRVWNGQSDTEYLVTLFPSDSNETYGNTTIPLMFESQLIGHVLINYDDSLQQLGLIEVCSVRSLVCTVYRQLLNVVINIISVTYGNEKYTELF